MTDADRHYDFRVRVKAYDRGSAEDRDRHALNIARALHRNYADRATVVGFAYDPLADDGHHPGHDAPLAHTAEDSLEARDAWLLELRASVLTVFEEEQRTMIRSTYAEAWAARLRDRVLAVLGEPDQTAQEPRS